MKRLKLSPSLGLLVLRKLVLILPVVFGWAMMVSNVPITVYAQFLSPPTTTFQQPINPFPVTPFQQPSTTPPSQFGGPGTGFLPPSATTFPPSVFPPTSSFLPSTSFAIPTGSLSPWFPSVPAISCGGTFSFTVIGQVSDHKGVDIGNGKQRIAIQINSAGGIDLTQQSIKGKIFVGQENIDSNQGNHFNIKNIFNNCQGLTFSR
ncbi:MAG TPA: hypothetical protein VEL70_08845 [Candidatus Acidoferrum sp.]|nr:hypothetical protein [Candidatus Acidoferrum sp.]